MGALKRLKDRVGPAEDFERTWDEILRSTQARWDSIVKGAERKADRKADKEASDKYEDATIESEKVGREYSKWSKRQRDKKTRQQEHKKPGEKKSEQVVVIEEKEEEEVPKAERRTTVQWVYESLVRESKLAFSFGEFSSFCKFPGCSRNLG